jgi:hypothetical protein
MPAVFNIISNGHWNFKNNPNNVKPSRGVVLCVIVARKNIILGKLQTSQKKPSQNELSCSMFHGFQAK